LRQSAVTAGLLDGVNAAAIALMAGVTMQLGAKAIVDWPTALLAIAALVALLRYRLNSSLVIAAGAACGALVALLR
jgi:chromate transporter